MLTVLNNFVPKRRFFGKMRKCEILTEANEGSH